MKGFFSFKAEDILPVLLKRFTNERVIAIVDPPRAGLRNYIFLKFGIIVLLEQYKESIIKF